MPEVDVDIAAGRATITIDRPRARNAIGLRTIGELGSALDAVERSEASVLVFRGAGDRAFVSGGDIKELNAIRDEAGAEAMASEMRNLLDRVASFPLPVLAALNGHALGGGAEVACAADIRLAARDVTIGFTQVRLGIMPAWGGAERLAELVGRSKALLLVGTGRTMAADEAARIGLVDDVAARPDFDDLVDGVAAGFTALAPGAARSIKAVIAAARPNTHPDLAPEAVHAFARLWASDHHWQAVAAMTEQAGRPQP